MVLKLFLFGSAFFFASCTLANGETPSDYNNKPHRRGGSPSSSSVVLSSSSVVVYSSSVAVPGSSSSPQPSSSSIVISSSSAAVSSSSVTTPSSSSTPPSSSSVASSSSRASSSSAIVPSSSSTPPSSSSVQVVQTGVIYGTPVTYEGETYQTVVIGTQTWMARNLNYNAEGSKCYGNNESNCATYGRLYNWATAMGLPYNCNENSCGLQIGTKHKGVCPSGWHIPSDAEWTTLTNFVGGSSTAGTKLRSTSGWKNNNNNSNGTDDYGFAALPGGGSDGNYSDVGYYGTWWSATEDYASGAYDRDMYYYDAKVGRNGYGKAIICSVRCVQD